jgi:hypothetical protein
MFYQEINVNKRGAMIAFLKHHARYNTLHAWNQSTSYANCIKLHKLVKPDDVAEEIWWELFTLPQWHEVLRDLLESFGTKHHWQWQAGINGRSGGYVLLYQGGIKPSGYQSYCIHCGQKNYQVVPQGQKGICGRCEAKARVNFKQPHMQVFTWPGKGTDMCEEFQDWTKDQLCSRVELIQDFDRLCDEIFTTYVKLCQAHRIVSRDILVPETIKVLEPVI